MKLTSKNPITFKDGKHLAGITLLSIPCLWSTYLMVARGSLRPLLETLFQEATVSQSWMAQGAKQSTNPDR